MPTGPDILRIGNASGFWGDRPDAAARLLAQSRDLDYLTLDYLAEVSMSILARQRQRDPSAGFARDFLDVVRDVAQAWRTGHAARVITNAGGLNPAACARAAADILRENGCTNIRIAIVSGDDCLAHLQNGDFPNLETARPIDDIRNRLVTANAYFGAAPIVQALQKGAHLVITGRVADPSLTVAPCVFSFNWAPDDYDRVAAATVAGHLIECGTQVTGGISTDWLELPNPRNIGFPIVEVSRDGAIVVTKPPDTGGQVTSTTVTEQLLYEIGDPDHYLSPDATVSFTSLQLAEAGPDRIKVAGAKGQSPPPTYKVSATYRAGYRAAGTLVVSGPRAPEKARRCADLILDRLHSIGAKPEQSLIEVLGARESSASEIVLRIAVSDHVKEKVEQFSRHFMSLITAGPQGITGYSDGRPQVREQFAYWPTLIDRARVHPQVEILEV